MKIIYTGRQSKLTPALEKKLNARFEMLSKMLERRGEKEARVTLTTERHLHHAEVTLNVYDHALAGVGSDADEFTAIHTAVEKLSKQVLKMRAKWRDTHRGVGVKDGWEEPASVAPPVKAAKAPAAAAKVKKPARQVYHVNDHTGRKPMTVEEAVMEMEAGQDYLVYRDARKNRVSVLMRR
ncbi:MAG: ribosome-associated translation inhibitor RaiA, partial [Bryobacteraceae bacterium]